MRACWPRPGPWKAAGRCSRCPSRPRRRLPNGARIDPERPDYARFPRSRALRWQTVRLGPGTLAPDMMSTRSGADSSIISEAAPSEAQCGFEARGSGPHHQHLLALGVGGDILRMPAAPPFLGNRRVLGAAQVHALIVRRAADVAADAFADLVQPAVADLRGLDAVVARAASVGATQTERA